MDKHGVLADRFQVDEPLALPGLKIMGFSVLHSFDEIYSSVDDWKAP